MGEGFGVGAVEGLQVHLPHADVEAHGHHGAEEFAACSGVERGGGEFVQAVVLTVVDDGVEADFPDEVVGGLGAEPRHEYAADAEAAVLHSEEMAGALQALPEGDETVVVVLNCYHSFIYQELENWRFFFFFNVNYR